MNLKKFKKSLVSIVLGSSLFLGNGGVICQQPRAWYSKEFFATASEIYGNEASIMILLGFLQRFSDYSRRSGDQVVPLADQFYDSYKSQQFIFNELGESTKATPEEKRRQLMLTSISVLIFGAVAPLERPEKNPEALDIISALNTIKFYEEPYNEIVQAMMDIIHTSAPSTAVELELLKLVIEASESVCSNQLQRQPDMFSTNSQYQYHHDKKGLLKNFVKFFSDKRSEPYYAIATSTLAGIFDTLGNPYKKKLHKEIMNLGPGKISENALIHMTSLKELFCLLAACCHNGISITLETCQRLLNTLDEGQLIQANCLPELLHTALIIPETILKNKREENPNALPEFIYTPCMQLLNELNHHASVLCGASFGSGALVNNNVN